MKPVSEAEHVATRAVAKKLVAELREILGACRKASAKPTKQEVESAKRSAEVIGNAVNRECKRTGLNHLWLKSYMYRIQRGEA